MLWGRNSPCWMGHLHLLDRRFNGKVRMTTEKALGYRTCEALEVALCHTLLTTCLSLNSPTNSADRTEYGFVMENQNGNDREGSCQ